MRNRWLEISPEADEKQEKCFENWLEGKSIEFENSEAKALYRERTQMIKDAIQLEKVPDRVPIAPTPGNFPIEYAGITHYQSIYETRPLIDAYQKYFDEFKTDVFSGPFPLAGESFDLLDFKLYRWAGHGISKDSEFQYVEQEYMKDDEYQDLIDDPSAWFLTVYFPRIFGSLESFRMMPVLPSINEITTVIPSLTLFANPDIQDAMNALIEASKAAFKFAQPLRQFSMSILAKGYPAMGGGFCKAPFDVIGDSLRGTRGVMMDMFRHPDELLEACERLVPIIIKTGITDAQKSGSPFIGMPLHKGADGFMSEEQFLTFYWPTLRKVLIGLADEGLVPCPFAEGEYDTRLEIISDLPKGKTRWMFDRTDMARAKKTIGQVACIQGNVPLDLLCTGRPEDVKEYCKNLIEVAAPGGGYIFSAGAAMTGAKAENVKALIDAGREFGVYN